jgi:hypothetical protein
MTSLEKGPLPKPPFDVINDVIKRRGCFDLQSFERRVSPVENLQLGIGTPSLITTQNQARLLFELAIGYRYPIAPLVFPPLMTSLVKGPLPKPPFDVIDDVIKRHGCFDL